jgi:RimJ/RimL family protein N-acetyltransferase
VAEVRIEPWGTGDRPLLEQLVGDPAMMEHLGGPESAEKIADRQGRYEQPGSGMFKIVCDGQACGSVGIWEREWRDRTVWETGWSVIPSFQGRGIAVAATSLVLARARESGEHRFVHAFPAVDNPASNAICRRLGFTLLEVCRFEYPPGNWLQCNDWQLDLGGVQPAL